MEKSKKRKIILSIVAISFIQGLQLCVSPVLAQIHEHFDTVDVSLVQMLITAPALMSMLVSLMAGVLVTKVSKKKILLFAGLVAGITGFLPFLADSFTLLFISRVLYGIGLGLAATLNTAVVAEFFEGDERVSVMGIQAASVGAGMVCITGLAGFLGSFGFTSSYYVNVIGLLGTLVIGICLPDTGVAGTGEKNEKVKIRLNAEVFEVALLAFCELFFLITFSTNISMHIAGELAGNTSVSGTLTAVFSGSQIFIGLVLGFIVKVAKKYTLPVAMLSYAIGAFLLVWFPGNFPMLVVASLFCGFSQGIFIPQGFVEVSNAVTPVAAAMAAAVFTCGQCIGQFLSPVTLNGISRAIFGDTTTSHIYLLSSIGITVIAVLVIIRRSVKTQPRQKPE